MLLPGSANCRGDDMLEALFPPSLAPPGEITKQQYDQAAADRLFPKTRRGPWVERVEHYRRPLTIKRSYRWRAIDVAAL